MSPVHVSVLMLMLKCHHILCDVGVCAYECVCECICMCHPLHMPIHAHSQDLHDGHAQEWKI
jgi:hypothetical protein